MNHIDRNLDVLLRKDTLKHIYTFKNFPVFMGCVNTPQESDILEDMVWYISSETGMIQLNPLLPLDVIYCDQHNSGVVGKLWNEHHESFSKFVCKFNPKNVLEIGGLHGILSRNCLIKNKNINWTMIEPNPIVDSDLPIKVIRGFFDSNFVSKDKYDTIIHSHVLEHIYDPQEFIKCQSSLLDIGGKLIFSIPNMCVMLKNAYTNCINFEHTLYFDEKHIEFLLESNGFGIIEKEYFKDDHSIFYCSEKKNVNSNINFGGLYKQNSEFFGNYINKHVNDVKNINEQINSSKVPVFLFGAHVFSQYLINFGLDVSKIKFVLDNDRNKQDKRLYGTNLICKSPHILKNYDSCILILRTGVYNDEIKKDILENINGNVKII